MLRHWQTFSTECSVDPEIGVIETALLSRKAFQTFGANWLDHYHCGGARVAVNDVQPLHVSAPDVPIDSRRAGWKLARAPQRVLVARHLLSDTLLSRSNYAVKVISIGLPPVAVERR